VDQLIRVVLHRPVETAGVTEMVRRLIFHLGVVDLVGRLLGRDHRYADSFSWH
jgi:hypothetical protein